MPVLQRLLPLATLAFGLGMSATPAHAATAPEAFRQDILDTSLGCYVSYEALQNGYSASHADYADVRSDAKAMAEQALQIFVNYANAFTSKEQAQALIRERNSLKAKAPSDERLIEIAKYCDGRLSELIEEANTKGYTP